ncbi:unnamed protein product, partial [Adineta ricciae]
VSGYGQQQDLTKVGAQNIMMLDDVRFCLQSWSPKPTVLPQQPLIRDDTVSGYGQQQDLTKVGAQNIMMLDDVRFCLQSWSPKPTVLPQQP